MDREVLPILNLCQFLVRFVGFLAQGDQAKGRICSQPCFGYAPAVLSFMLRVGKANAFPGSSVSSLLCWTLLHLLVWLECRDISGHCTHFLILFKWDGAQM